MAGIGVKGGPAEKALNSVRDLLDTPYGVSSSTRTYKEYPTWSWARSRPIPRPTRENGGIFCHNNPWITIAETIIGRGDRALSTYQHICPAYTGGHLGAAPHRTLRLPADDRLRGCAAPGRGQEQLAHRHRELDALPVTQYILGIRPQYDGLMIDPCIRTVGGLPPPPHPPRATPPPPPSHPPPKEEGRPLHYRRRQPPCGPPPPPPGRKPGPGAQGPMAKPQTPTQKKPPPQGASPKKKRAGKGKRYSFGYAVFLILALMKLLWIFPGLQCPYSRCQFPGYGSCPSDRWQHGQQSSR